MKKNSALLAVVAATVLLLFAALALQRSVATPQRSHALDLPAQETHPETGSPEEFLYGRIATVDGASYEGRLRWGGGREEAFWGDYYMGFKDENRWADDALLEELATESRPVKILGVEVARRENPIDLRRPFMVRFGDIARIEARGGDVRVILKGGTAFNLDRFSAGDFDDGVRVWDDNQGVVDLDSLRIYTIEFLPTPSTGAAPYRLHGTVSTSQGEFSGFVRWNREESVAPDELDGRTVDGELSLPYNAIRSIAKRSRDTSLVTLLDGREFELTDSREVGQGNRGVYVDDPRYGRVLISWEIFERVDFSPGGSGLAYGDFPAGRALTGRVTTRAGARFSGRLVFDLDESETVETLDAPWQGVDYTLPFGLIASIVPSREAEGARSATVTLHDGEELQLEHAGDLGDGNAGMLIFVEGRDRPEYVPWAEVAQVDFDGR